MKRYSKVPYAVRLILTGKCNLKCDFCLMDTSTKADKGELHTDEWLKFFERLKELQVFSISISGGEIFLRNDLFLLLKRLRDNRMHRISLLTNGTLITEKVAKQLKEINIKYMSISIDGLKENHNQIRGSGTFQKAINGIRYLKDVGIKPQISFTPMKSNYKDLAPLVDYIVSMGLPSIRVNTLTPEGRCLDLYQDIALEYPLQIKELLDIVEAKREEYPNFKISCNIGFYYHLPQTYRYFKENPQKEHKIKHLKDGCGAASTSCVITSTGDIIPCEGFPTFIGGNIRERDFLEIWENSENFKKIRNLSNIAMDETTHCKNCKYNFLCDGGCRAIAYLLYKDLLAPDSLCPFWKNDQFNEIQ